MIAEEFVFWQGLNYDGIMQRGSAQLLLILAIVVILVMGGGYFYLDSKGENPLPGVKITPLKTSPADDYSNQGLGFGFTYPKDFTVKEDSEEEFNQRGNGNFRKNFKGYVGYEPGEFLGAVVVLDQTGSFDTNPFTLWVFDNPGDLTADGWFDKYWYYPFVWGVFDYSSKGHIALEKEATVSGEAAKYKVISYQPGNPKFVYLSKDKKMYLFRVIGNTGDQILSTFRFLQ